MRFRCKKVRVLADVGQSLQYSNTSFRICGMNETCPLAGAEVSRARKSGIGFMPKCVDPKRQLFSCHRRQTTVLTCLDLLDHNLTMPELPEVNRAKNLVNRLATGKTIQKVETAEDPIVFTGITHEDFANELAGRKVESAGRYGIIPNNSFQAAERNRQSVIYQSFRQW